MTDLGAWFGQVAGLMRRHSGRGRFLRSDDAIAITEYGLLVAFVALAVIAVIVIFGGGISSWFATKTGNITTN